ncbi:hypothetical protein [Rhodanobacter hydrolyticus]|uniref:Uncharacterized protein n=1 Tax=Rhodanobacter hydrolyticus TaxID=2250595 RepID=A0ABW8JAY2_9GAMM
MFTKLLPSRGAAFFLLMGLGLAVADEAPRSFDPIRMFLGPELHRQMQQPEVLASDGRGEHYRMFLLPNLQKSELTTPDVLPDGSGDVHYRVSPCSPELSCGGVALDQHIHVTRIQVDAFRQELAVIGFWHRLRVIHDDVADGAEILVDGVRSGERVQFMRSSICPGRGKSMSTYEEVMHAFGRLRGISPKPTCIYL